MGSGQSTTGSGVSTPFPSTSISLINVSQACGVGSSFSGYRMSGLIGKSVYSSPNDPSTGTVIGSSPQLSVFRGKYVGSGGTLAGQEAFGQDGRLGHGVESRAGFNNASYTISNGKVISLSLNFYLNDRGTGSSSSSGTNSPNISIRQNGSSTPVFQDSSTGSKTVTLSATTFTISLSGNASNNWGDQASASGSWTYNVTTTGLSGP